MQEIVINEADQVVSEVIVGEGLLADAAAFLPERESRRRIAIIAQPTVGAFVDGLKRSLSAMGAEVAVIVLPDGEPAKSLATVEAVAMKLNRLGLSRSDTIVGVGGGAATDVAGFIAATYLRGVECVAAPTTLLGAVDAAIGGKTGVNVGGKNLIGVDIGTSAVKVVQLKESRRGVHIMRFGIEPLQMRHRTNFEIQLFHLMLGEIAQLQGLGRLAAAGQWV